LGHELVHAFQRDILRQTGRPLATLPLWFVEGMAEYLSIGDLDSNTLMWLRDAVAQDRLPRIDELDNPRWFPYRYGQALWWFLADRYGPKVIRTALKWAGSGGALKRLTAATGTTISTLSQQWHEAIRERIAVMPTGPCCETNSRTVIAPGKNGGRLNVAPALSPDGRYLVFLSERDQFSVDVYLADASSGNVIRRLLNTAVDSHFDSIQFIDSSGSWSS